MKKTLKYFLLLLIVFLVLLLISFIDSFKAHGIIDLLDCKIYSKDAKIIMIKDIIKNNDEYSMSGNESWFLVENRPYDVIILDLDLKGKEKVSGKVYYADSSDNFDETKIRVYDFANGKNIINIQCSDANYLRIDFHEENGFTFKVNQIKAQTEVYYFVYNFSIYILLISIVIIFVFKLILKTNEKDSKIDKIFWIIIILSLVVIFSKFLIGSGYYMYLDTGQDTVNQYYPYFVNEVLNIKNGTFSIWNFNYGLGANLLNFSSWTFDIFAIILVLLGAIFGIGKLNYLLAIMQILKILIIYILSKKFLSHFIKDETAKCLASYLSAMNGYIFLWGQHYFLGTASVYLLFMLCCIENVLSKKSKYSYTALSLLVASLLLFSYYIGYMVLLAGGVYFLFRYFSLNKNKNLKSIFSDFGKCAGSVIIGVLLSGIILIPACYNLITTSSRLEGSGDPISIRIMQAFTSSFDFDYISRTLTRFISNNIIFSSAVDSKYYEAPEIFCTIFIFFFIIQWIIYELKKAETKKDYVIVGLKVIALIFLIFNNVTGLIFNAFVTPAYRYTYILFPFFGIIIGTVWEKVIKENKINLGGLMISIIISIYTCIYTILKTQADGIDAIIIISLSLIIGYILLLFIRNKNIKNKQIFASLFLFIIICTTCFDNYITTNKRVFVTPSTYSLKWDRFELVNDTGKAISWLKENDKSFYRVEKNYTNFSRLGDSFIELVSTTLWYNSTLSSDLSNFYKNIYKNADTLQAIKLFSLKDKLDLQALYLTNSKYILSKTPIDMEGMDKINKIGEVYIYRNTYTENIAKFFTKTISENEYINLERDNQETALYETAIIDNKDANLIKLDKNVKSEVNDFYIEKPTHLTGKVKCDGTGLLMVGIPYQEGWTAFVDGKPVEKLYKVDYGFIGINISTGEHTVELKYELPKLNIGIISTIIGIIGLSFMFFIERVHIKKETKNAQNKDN